MAEQRLTRAKAIRAKCLDCCYGSANEVRRRLCVKCSLFSYRFGHIAREGSNYTAEERNGEKA